MRRAVVDVKGPSCPLTTHVSGLPLYDYREALRPPTRIGPPLEEEFEEEEEVETGTSHLISSHLRLITLMSGTIQKRS